MQKLVEVLTRATLTCPGMTDSILPVFNFESFSLSSTTSTKSPAEMCCCSTFHFWRICRFGRYSLRQSPLFSQTPGVTRILSTQQEMIRGKTLEVFNIIRKRGQGSIIQDGLDLGKDRHKSKVADKATHLILHGELFSPNGLGVPTMCGNSGGSK